MSRVTTKPVLGRLYQDETGGFWVGGEDGRFWQPHAEGYAAVPHYLHHFRDANSDIEAERGPRRCGFCQHSPHVDQKCATCGCYPYGTANLEEIAEPPGRDVKPLPAYQPPEGHRMADVAPELANTTAAKPHLHPAARLRAETGIDWPPPPAKERRQR